MSPKQEEDGGSLIDVLSDLREAIEQSQGKLEAAGKEGLFRFDTVEVEANVVVEKSKGGEAGVRWHFITVGGKANYKIQQVHKLKLVLRPTREALQRGEDVVAGTGSGPPPPERGP